MMKNRPRYIGLRTIAYGPRIARSEFLSSEAKLQSWMNSPTIETMNPASSQSRRRKGTAAAIATIASGTRSRTRKRRSPGWLKTERSEASIGRSVWPGRAGGGLLLGGASIPAGDPQAPPARHPLVELAPHRAHGLRVALQPLLVDAGHVEIVEPAPP